MFTLTTKKTAFIAILLFLSFSTKAFIGINPKLISRNIELSVVNANTISIKTNLFTLNNETFEIEKSYDNKNFQTVAVVFAFEPNEMYKPLQVKDKLQNGAKKVYYRVKKVENGKVTYILSKNIQLI